VCKARDQSFIGSFSQNLFQNFNWLSAVTVIITTQLTFFIASVSLNGLSDNSFLAVPEESLVTVGAKDTYLMRYNYQMWRFLTANVLHYDIVHLLCNMLGMLIIGQTLEKDMGTLNFTTAVLIIGFGATLFSAMNSNEVTCGGSPVLYGFVGIFMACLIVNWTWFKDNKEKRCKVLIGTLLTILVALSTDMFHVDPFGNLGGFLVGIMAGLWLLPPYAGN
jgi:membrane associated rhomboid family serine protease